MINEKETKTESTTTGTEDDGDQLQTASPIEAANQAAERLEEANKVKEQLLVAEEKLQINRTLGGKADAGQEPVEKKEEESDLDYAKRALSGKMNDK